MGLDYRFELIAPRIGADALLRALADRVGCGYGQRLRACLPWSPSSPHAADAGVRGLPPVFGISNYYDLVVLLPVDAAVRRYFGGGHRSIARHMEGDKVGVGLVYMKLYAGERFVMLRLAAATTEMSLLFAGPGSARKVMTSLAAAGQARAAFLDCERDGDWELLFPRPATTVPRPPPDGQQRRADVDAYCELALELAAMPP